MAPAATATATAAVQVDWMEDKMPYYPPTVNDPQAFKFAMDVAGRWVQQTSRSVPPALKAIASSGC